MLKQPLHENWTVRAVGDLSEVPAALRDVSVRAMVPGCVHTDLMRAGKIDDPYRGLNEFKTRWIGHTDWEYRTTFDADAKLFDHERIDLVCDGLDTVAAIVLNGREVARTQNMHRGYRFDVRPTLKRGSNELVVTFASPVKYAEAMREKLKPRPYVNGPGGAFNFIRKMACNFGWDWGPALPTSGIWRGVRLEGWSVARLDKVLPRVVKATTEEAMVEVDVVLIRASEQKALTVDGFLGYQDQVVGDSQRSDATTVTLRLALEGPELWWPVATAISLCIF